MMTFWTVLRSTWAAPKNIMWKNAKAPFSMQSGTTWTITDCRRIAAEDTAALKRILTAADIELEKRIINSEIATLETEKAIAGALWCDKPRWAACSTA